MNETVKVLLVEDHAADAELVRYAIESQGATHQLVHVDALKPALERLYSDEEFDAVLLDWLLPDVEGLEGLEKVRAQRPEVPVIILTSNEEQSLVAAALHEGAQDYLLKSELDGAWLIRSVRYAAERQRLILELGEMQDLLSEVMEREKQDAVAELTQALRPLVDTAMEETEKMLVGTPSSAGAKAIHLAVRCMKEQLDRHWD